METSKKFDSARSLISNKFGVKFSRAEHAKLAGIDITTLGALERGDKNPRLETVRKAEAVLISKGVVFTEYGLELRDNYQYEISGDNWWLKVLDDVKETLRHSDKKEWLMMCADDKLTPPEANEKIREIIALGVALRQITWSGNHYLMGDIEDYRWLPKAEYLGNVTFIYGNKVGVCVDGNTKAAIHVDDRAAVSQRGVFNALFDRLEKPEYSDAKEKF